MTMMKPKPFTVKSTNMKKLFYLVPALLLIGLSSCLTSLNPLVTDQNIETYNAAVGTWRSDIGYTIKIQPYAGSPLQHEMERITSKENQPKSLSAKEARLTRRVYVLSFTRNAVDHYMFLAFTRINGRWFAQVEPITAGITNRKLDDESATLWGPLKGEHTYSFARVDVVNGALQFTPPDHVHLEHLMDNGMMALPFEREALFDTQLITATPAQLQSFFAKYGGDPQLFNKNTTLVFKQPSL